MLGLSAGLCAREQLRRGASVWRSAYPAGVLFHVLFVLTPLSLILALGHPDWASLKFFEPEGATAGIWLASLSAGLILALGSFGLQALLKRQKARMAWVPFFLGLAGLIFVMVFFSTELASTSADEDAHGPLLVTLVFCLPVVLAGWFFLLVLYALEGRKMRSLDAHIQAQIRESEAVGLADTRAKA
ncbi:MAG: hypothetical protein JRF33_05165 [Deltaproteobacteria bacterium]|nr:hypothetical protein [Deltaproteobacteria bacterium]